MTESKPWRESERNVRAEEDMRRKRGTDHRGRERGETIDTEWFREKEKL